MKISSQQQQALFSSSLHYGRLYIGSPLSLLERHHDVLASDAAHVLGSDHLRLQPLDLSDEATVLLLEAGALALKGMELAV
jgi:hypothetical protein